MLKYLINKKGMSPVVSTALLLVVAVASVGIFQGWFQTYSSGLFSGMEQDTSIDVINTRIDGVLGNNLYFKNGYNNLTITEIKLNNVSCIVDESYGQGMQIINISGCVETHQSTAEVVVVTNRGLFTKTLFVYGDGSSSEEVYSSCTLDEVNVDHGDNNTFYNTSSVPFGDSCSSISRTCNNGTFDGDTSYNYSNCSVDAQDTMPDAFNFTDQTDVELDTLIESNTLTPTDYEGPLIVGITGDGSPQISIDDGSSWTTSDDMNPGDTLAIRLNSSSNYNVTNQVNLTLGDYSTIWSVKTKFGEECTLDSITRDHGESYSFYNSRSVPFGSSCSSISRTCNNGTFDGDTSYNYSNCSVDAQDTMPNAFSFTDQTDVELDTLIESNTLTPTDYEGPLSVGITGDGTPELSVNGGGYTTSTTMNPGDSLTIRLNSSSAYLTTSQANLTLGDYSTIWSVETKEDSLDCSALSLVGGEWISVPGNSYFGTSDFCVMKYEAKNVGGVPTSQASNNPWVDITFTDAFDACNDLGEGYRLITNRQWMTIARDAEGEDVNWVDSGGVQTSVGVGALKQGNVGSGGIDGASYNGADPEQSSDGVNDIGMLTLSNGEVIWDLSGNVWEWVDAMEDGTALATGNACGGNGWHSYFGNDGESECSFDKSNPAYRKTGASDRRFEMGPLGDYNANHGVGRIYSYTSSNRALLRGGAWDDGAAAGAFSVNLYNGPSSSNTYNGFRCVYEP